MGNINKVGSFFIGTSFFPVSIVSLLKKKNVFLASM